MRFGKCTKCDKKVWGFPGIAKGGNMIRIAWGMFFATIVGLGAATCFVLYNLIVLAMEGG